MTKKSVVILLCFAFFANSISPLITNAASKVMSYDANGNILNDGEFCYTYNDANRLKEIRKCSGNVLVAEYTYNFAGQRLTKKVYKNGVFEYLLITVNDIYDLKINADGSEEQTTYYKANDELIAHKTTKNGTSTLSYHQNDHLGSASIVTDTSGNITEETRYFPYGTTRSGGTESKTGRYQYTNQEKDSETNLMYYGARYYSPIIGRFVQPDSMLPDIYDPQQLNRYAYVRNNPLKYTDPTGHCATGIGIDTLFCGFGAGVSTALVAGGIVITIGTATYVVSCIAITCEQTNENITNNTKGMLHAAGSIIAGTTSYINLQVAKANTWRMFEFGTDRAKILALTTVALIANGIDPDSIDKGKKEQTNGELKKGKQSYQDLIDEHLDKIKNPDKYMKDYDPKVDGNRELYKEGLLKKWGKDIERAKKEIEKIDKILNSRK